MVDNNFTDKNDVYFILEEDGDFSPYFMRNISIYHISAGKGVWKNGCFNFKENDVNCVGFLNRGICGNTFYKGNTRWDLVFPSKEAIFNHIQKEIIRDNEIATKCLNESLINNAKLLTEKD